MPVSDPNAPTVAVQVPVPTPVQRTNRRRTPVSFPNPSEGPVRSPRPNPALPPPSPTAVILPWTPPRKMSRAGKVRRYAEAQPFLDAHSQGMDPTHLLALADRFEEQGDPRAELLRRHAHNWSANSGERLPLDMSRFVIPGTPGGRGAGTYFGDAWGARNDPGGYNTLHFGVDELSGQPSSRQFRPTHVVMRWGRSVEDPNTQTPGRTHPFRHWVFQEAFTPQEMRGIAEKYPNYRDRIHAFIDQHFPHVPRPEKWKEENEVPIEPFDPNRLSRRGPTRRYAGKRPTVPLTGEDYLLPPEVEALAKTQQSGLKEMNKNIRQGLSDKPGLLPGVGELEALAQLGGSVKGAYRNQFDTIASLVPHPEDAGRWATINAILSANSGFEEHTKDAIQGLANWHDRGRPTDPKGLDAVFGKVVTAQVRDPKTGEPKFDKNGNKVLARQWVPGTGLWKGTRSVWGDKIDKIKEFLSTRRQKAYGGEVDWGDISKGAFKTANFGISFVDPKGTALDTHMARLLTPGRPFTESGLHQMALGLGSKKMYGAIKKVRDKVVSNKINYLAYKTLVGHAAQRLGWEPREVQEAVWTAVIGIMALRYADEGLMKVPDAKKIAAKLDARAVAAGWDITSLFDSEGVRDSLEKLEVDPKRLKHVLKQSQKAKEAAIAGRPGVGNRAALESAARRIGAADLKTAASVPIIEHLTGKSAEELAGRKKLSRRVIRYMAASINVSRSGETPHESLTRLLGSGSRRDPHFRRLGATSSVWRNPQTGDMHVTLHRTNVVTAHPDGSVTLNHGGYLTPTTRRFMGYANPLIRNVSFAGGRFRVLTDDGWKDYENNTRYSPGPASDPEDLVRGSYGHKNFVDRMIADPHERTHVAAYADWLEENGHTGMAEVVRRALAEKIPAHYNMISHTPTDIGQGVPEDAGEGVPYAWATRYSPDVSNVGVLFRVPAEKLVGGSSSIMFQNAPRGFFTSMSPQDAHRALSNMRDMGVANAHAALAAVERAHPQLAGKKYSRISRRRFASI